MDTVYLNLPGVSNARELGGYRIGEKKIIGGRLLRTGALDGIEEEGIKQLRDTYHVQKVIDFRMSEEHDSLPDPVIPDAVDIHIPIFEMKDMTADADPALVEQYNNQNMDRMAIFTAAYDAGALTDKMYVDFLMNERGKKGWKRFFEELLTVEDDRAFLWHCRDGKDRAGCGAMLILSALGADKETILWDYCETNTRIEKKLNAIRMQVAPLGWPEDKVDALIFISGGVIEYYMANAMKALEKNYGSVQGYLREELGVGDTEVEILRNRYLR